jgi:hypothetical protein
MAPVTVNELLEGHVGLDIESLDRVYLNGYVPNLQVEGSKTQLCTLVLSRLVSHWPGIGITTGAQSRGPVVVPRSKLEPSANGHTEPGRTAGPLLDRNGFLGDFQQVSYRLSATSA